MHCASPPALGGVKVSWPGLPSGHRRPGPTEPGQPEERKVKSNFMRGICSDLSVSVSGCLGRNDCILRADLCSCLLSLPWPPPPNRTRCIFLAVAGQPLCHLVRHLLFPLSQAIPGLVASRSTSVESERFCTETQSQSAREYICKRGKFPICILPKHLTRIKVSPRGTNFTY